MRPTITDIANESGFSTATVDRVLNKRSGVRSRTCDIVLQTARRLGYISDGSGLAKPVADHALSLDFVLPMGTNKFIQMLLQQLDRQGSTQPDLDVRIHMIEGFNPDTLAMKLHELRGQTQGVGVIALDHPTVREAIRTLSADGVKVVTIATDISHVPRVAYVGIDNRQAGRLAGYILGRFLGTAEPRKVVLLAGSLSYRGHEEREMGFRHVLAEKFPNLQIVELREVHDDREKAYIEAAALLERYDDLAAMYNVGAGNTGIGRALQEHNRSQSVVFLAHEATEGNKALLLDGTIDALIDQNPRVEARESLNILRSSIRRESYEYHGPRLQIIFQENLPE